MITHHLECLPQHACALLFERERVCVCVCLCTQHSRVIEMALFQRNMKNPSQKALRRVQFNLNVSASVCFI